LLHANETLAAAEQTQRTLNEEYLVASAQAQASTQTYNEEFQAISEEMETLNEELKAANEELTLANTDQDASSSELAAQCAQVRRHARSWLPCCRLCPTQSW
jgi:hypothetical protein